METEKVRGEEVFRTSLEIKVLFGGGGRRQFQQANGKGIPDSEGGSEEIYCRGHGAVRILSVEHWLSSFTGERNNKAAGV